MKALVLKVMYSKDRRLKADKEVVVAGLTSSPINCLGISAIPIERPSPACFLTVILLRCLHDDFASMHP